MTLNPYGPKGINPAAQPLGLSVWLYPEEIDLLTEALQHELLSPRSVGARWGQITRLIERFDSYKRSKKL